MTSFNFIRKFYLGLLFLVSACTGKGDEDAQFSAALQMASQTLKSDADVLKIEQITHFDWDQAFLFAPYTPTREISRITGIDASTIEQTGIEARDDIHLFVFLQKKALAKVIAVERRKINFSKAKSGQILTHQTAIFYKDAQANTLTMR